MWGESVEDLVFINTTASIRACGCRVVSCTAREIQLHTGCLCCPCLHLSSCYTKDCEHQQSGRVFLRFLILLVAKDLEIWSGPWGSLHLCPLCSASPLTQTNKIYQVHVTFPALCGHTADLCVPRTSWAPRTSTLTLHTL